MANFKDRLSALETKIANEGIMLNDAQIAALEKKKQDDIASGETETMHPGYSFNAGHILCGQPERGGLDVYTANLHRYLLQGSTLQALHHQNTDYLSRYPE